MNVLLIGQECITAPISPLQLHSAADFKIQNFSTNFHLYSIYPSEKVRNNRNRMVAINTRPTPLPINNSHNKIRSILTNVVPFRLRTSITSTQYGVETTSSTTSTLITSTIIPIQLRMTRENCKKIARYSCVFGVANPRQWVRANCQFVQTFAPNATCQDIGVFVDSCYVQRFL